MKLNLLILAISISLIYFYANFNSIFVSDELDYLDAIESGFLENYFESQSISTYDFFKQTISAFINSKEINLWQEMHKQNDVMSARHFHGPFAFYSYVGFAKLFPQFSLRYLSLFWTVLLIILALFAVNNCAPIICNSRDLI